MPVPPDPVTVATVRTGTALLGKAWGAGVRLRDAEQAHRAIGEVVSAALALAICPDDPHHESARSAAAAVERRLRLTVMPSATGRSPGRTARRVARVRLLARRNRVPEIALFGESDFFVLLSRWLAEALTDLDVETEVALGRVTCRDAAAHAVATPDVLCIQFPAAFLQVLAESSGSAWRTRLLKSLQAADAHREALRNQLSWTNIALGLPAVGGVAGAAILSGATDHTTLIATLGALGITVPAQLVAVWRRRADVADPLRGAVRDEACRWLGDFRRATEMSHTDANPGESLEWLGKLAADAKPPVVPDHLTARLARLAQAAKDHGDNDLAVLLFKIEMSLRRVRDYPLARAEALACVKDLASVCLPAEAAGAAP